MPRELVVLGTASQVPTRTRHHNAYLLRWDDTVTLFDPGEGTQRQILLAGIPISAISRVCLTHFHGDHCLGLPGVIQRLSLEAPGRQLPIVFPAGGRAYLDRLHHASIFEEHLDVVPVAVTPPADGSLIAVDDGTASASTLLAGALHHTVEAVGWRIEEPAARTFVPEQLAEAGISGPDVGRLRREGALDVGGRRVTYEEASVTRPPQAVAFVMDTAWCDGALALARDADLLVCEATFAGREAARAARWGHLTATQAGRLAREAGARRLVITHFSQRYPDTGPLAEEAAEAFGGEVIAATDLARIPVPPRRAP